MRIFLLITMSLIPLCTFSENVTQSSSGNKSPVVNAQGNVVITYEGIRVTKEREIRKDEIESRLYKYMNQGEFDFASALNGLAPQHADFNRIFKAPYANEYYQQYTDILDVSVREYRDNSADYVGVDDVKIKSTIISEIISQIESDLANQEGYDHQKAEKRNQLAFYNTFRVSDDQRLYKMFFTTRTPFALGNNGGIVYMKPRLLYGFSGKNDTLVVMDAPNLYKKAFKKVYYEPEPVKAGIVLTPFFGITPGITTRGEVQELIESKKLAMFGSMQKGTDSTMYKFKYGVINLTGSGSSPSEDSQDTVSNFEYWGNEELPLGFSAKSELEDAKKIGVYNFYWLGTQSYRGLVFSNKPDGPILLEISWRPKNGSNLVFSIYGQI